MAARFAGADGTRAWRHRHVAGCVRTCTAIIAPASEPSIAAAAVNLAPTTIEMRGGGVERDTTRRFRGMWPPLDFAPIRC
jgi:hypothetical protein